MKILHKFLFAGIAAATLSTSCKKDLLDVNPRDQLSTTVFWKSEKDADLALTGLYNYLYATGGNWGCSQYEIMGWDGYTDDVYSQHDYGGGRAATSSGITPNSGGYVANYYANNYRALAAINSFLANVDKVLTGDKLTQYKAEAHFLRAFNYLYLAQLYGNVPLITEDPFTLDFNKGIAKASKTAILEFVLDELDIAIAGLPDVGYTTGHAVKATALGYKVRALMELKQFATAAATAKQIIDGNKFSLHTNYAANFYKAGQRTSPEIMFSVVFLAPNIVHADAALNVAMHRWGGFAGTQNLIDEYEEGDPRLTMTWFFAGDGADKGWPFDDPAVASPGSGEWPANFYIPKKWLTPGVRNPDYGLQGDNDYVLLRYADIKLLYAEAQNEAAGPDASVYQQVNEVRDRPGVEMPALPTGLSQAEMRERIRHERRVELPLEGIRYFDLRRWGIAKEKINGFAPNPVFPDIQLKYEEKYEYWPIPQTEIDRNKGLLEQNPGY
ncbi:RagB/SusD family nutrient uptake outer membrane protein [Flavihumibacter sp. UBA7668]|uniref:RagB/SusD family nutrient uptake outer membrane protein n=1 Tax=Flavihumibacter sp. UBA7668 TaxID=1946542 RepID=UPI0025B9FFCA|nr:RagB/SusD family nutrient uptake outer membrane protein [Flavihumibacter sp. UBA7668]